MNATTDNPGSNDGASAEQPGELSALVTSLRACDQLRAELRAGTGSRRHVLHLRVLLTTPVRVGAVEISLDAPVSFARLFALDGLPGLHLEVRSDPLGLPVYYLARLRDPFWSDGPGSVVEEHFRSPGYPRPDHRYERITVPGQGVRVYLRVAWLRPAAVAAAGAGARDVSLATDRLLSGVAEDVLFAAWHEDQRLAVAVAQTLGIPELRDAVESLYLILQSDLSELRARVTPALVGMLGAGYRHADFAGVLEKLAGLDGDQLLALRETAGLAYRRLARAFARFLRIEVSWRSPQTGARPVPLFKALVANIRDLDAIAPLIAPSDALECARRDLAEHAARALAELRS